MEAIIQAKTLKTQVAALQGILARKQTVPTLSRIKIVAADSGELVMTATDLDVSLIIGQETDVLKPGAVCVSGKKLNDIAQALANEPVHLRLDAQNEKIELKAGRYTTKLAGADADTFPEVPRATAEALRLPAMFVSAGLKRTLFAVSEDQSRFLLNAVLLTIENSELRMISTDGRRLCYFRVATTAAKNQNLECLIPGKAARELRSLVADELKINDKAEIKIKKGAQLEFEIGNKVLAARELTGTFPNWQMVLPKNHRRFVEFNAKALREALLRVGVLADDTHRRIEFVFFADKVMLVSRAPETGEAVEEVNCNFQTIANETASEETEATAAQNGWKIAFNARYIADFFAIHTGKKDDQRIIWKFGEQHEQSEMIYEGEDRFFSYILVPLKA